MYAIEELAALREQFSIQVDALDRIVACSVTDLRTRAQLYAKWASLQQRKCELIAQGQADKTIAVRGQPRKEFSSQTRLLPGGKPLKSLEELGITPDQSSQWTYSPRVIAKAERALRKGLGWRATARKLGLAPATLLRRIQFRKRRPQFTAKEAALAMRQLDGGETWSDVAARFGIKRSTLEFRLFKFGWHGKQKRMAA